MAGFLSKILSIGENRQLKRFQGLVDRINSLEPQMEARTDAQLAELTGVYRERVANGESLDHILPEAFATMREASKRVLGMRHFDVQLIGGMTLNAGQIAEMKTGEGKTLVSTLAGYLNALSGENVHIVTVNDYLAKRDCEWMGRAYGFLGMSTGLIQSGMSPMKKIPAYKADITYGTNSEFGFDYLRDNMVTSAANRVQRGHHFAIVDEVDSILIDEARTPLIISGAGVEAADTFRHFARAMKGLQEGVDFEMDEAKKTIYPTESGLVRIENSLGIDDLYADPTGMLANHLQQALKAEFLFHKDIDYIVADGEVKIVDEFTGRIMEGRRWSEGLHQAIEAKEGVFIRQENQTLATITLQNYFRLYDKLSGMTGTAMTEDSEFRQIYNLPVMAIPPNKPVIRKDENDLIYRTIEAKYNAVADDIARRNKEGQPVLVGTVSIENSERLSRLLSKRGIRHEVLNAKNHEREAHIVAQAGRVGAVTIATNMAGRGTDILLGGNPEVLADDLLIAQGFEDLQEVPEEARKNALAQAKEVTEKENAQVIAAGGLCVIGTERHESRRIDNQLRGRSGRQGDPGTTQFYLSLEDDLMRLFGGARMEKVGAMMQKTAVDDDMPIQASMVSKAIENAQRQVETIHFAARKNVLEYDDVMNLQRKAIYEERNAILEGKDLTSRIPEIIEDCVEGVVAENCSAKHPSDDWDCKAVDRWMADMEGFAGFTVESVDHDDDPMEVARAAEEELMGAYNEKREILGDEAMSKLQAQIMLRIIDTRWMSHLQEMDYLKAGIGLRAIGQRDPLVEYKNEAHRAFGELTDGMYESFLRTILRLQIARREEAEIGEARNPLEGKLSYSNPEGTLSAESKTASAGREAAQPGQPPKPVESQRPKTFVKDKDDPYANVGRNDPCPCGSGKKFKKCHGANRG
ncbi:MAG: preprotein translocase subunit SecA [Eggerthellaceae bacterium]